MINHILSAIDNTLKRKSEFIDSKTAFTRERDWPLDRHVMFQIFREKTTTRHDINTFYLNGEGKKFKRVTRGNFSRQREYINPNLFKEINKEFLKQIKYDTNRSMHETYKGLYLLAVDGLTIAFDNNKELRKEFKVKKKTLKYTQPSEAKFSGLMDLLNGYMLDGELGHFRQSERDLLKMNILNAQDIIDFEKVILTLDRGYVSLEMMAWLKELNIYFVQRLNNSYYKKEVSEIKTCDSPIKLSLKGGRMRGFKDPEIKEKYRDESYLELRIVTVKLESGKIERLLTNIPPEIMSTDDIYHIYGERWVIETNYNKLKNRHEIENFTSNKLKNIKQDVYSTLITYNITMEYNNICNKILENKMKKQRKNKKVEDKYEYKIDYANLTRNLNKSLDKMIINPTKENINFHTSWLLYESCLEPNKILKDRRYPRYKRTNGNSYSRSYGEM